MMKMKQAAGIVTGAMMAAGLLASAPANAVVLTELALVIDESGSINSANWAAQMTAYKNAILSVVPTDGSVAIGVISFGSSANVRLGMTTITAGNINAFANAVGALGQIGGNTCISCGIQLGTQMLAAFGDRANRQIIDVSTDGLWNVGVDPAGAAVGSSDWAVGTGIVDQVNAIGIGVNPDFESGVGSFSLQVADFGLDFENAITTKIAREATGQVPEPATMLMVGLGLAGIGFMRRRKVA